MKNSPPHFRRSAASPAFAYAFGGVLQSRRTLYIWLSKICGVFLEEALKKSTAGTGKVHSPGGGCKEPYSSHCPAGLVQVSMARTAHMPKRLGQMCQHTEVFLLNSQSLPQAIGFADTA